MEAGLELFTQLQDIISSAVHLSKHAGLYRAPIVSTVSAHHPGFNHLKTDVLPEHLLPSELLPTAQSVLAFFLPFQRELTRHNRQPQVAREWAWAYRN